MFVSFDDLIVDWRRRWSSDCYSFLFGMAFGLTVCVLKRLNLVDDYETNVEHDNLDSRDVRDKRREQTNLPSYLKIFLILVSLGGLIGYILFAIFCRSKENCDYVTTYITVIPVSIKHVNFVFKPFSYFKQYFFHLDYFLRCT